MNEQQRTAMAFPCEYPEQCGDPRYGIRKRSGDVHLTIVLTINIGDE